LRLAFSSSGWNDAQSDAVWSWSETGMGWEEAGGCEEDEEGLGERVGGSWEVEGA